MKRVLESQQRIKQAKKLAEQDIITAPCKCGVCFANLVLKRAAEIRASGPEQAKSASDASTSDVMSPQANASEEGAKGASE